MTLSPDTVEFFRALAVAGLVLAGAGIAAEIVARRRPPDDPHAGRIRDPHD